MRNSNLVSIIVGLSLGTLVWSAAGPQPALAQPPVPTPRVNVPYFAGDIDLSQGVIFWFGQVNNTTNYADGLPDRFGKPHPGLSQELNGYFH